MLYAVIHDNRLLSLHRTRDDAKDAALQAATEGMRYVDFAYFYEPDHERWEVLHRADRRRRWTRSGYYIATTNLAE
ncbi:hypothetical protein AB0E62_27395 [Streptomyces sp. NPDC038707]|uniref:hypothetical protein n=1 Tax=Streptomyces sp. NPDC038707 TaxID=3154329 RepID=UPI0033DB49D4